MRLARSCRGRGQGRGQRATRAGQRAARFKVQKHKPTTANDPLKVRSSSAFNFRVKDWARWRKDATRQAGRQIALFYVQPSSDFADPPCGATSFEVNSEPHTGARPSVCLRVGLIIRLAGSGRSRGAQNLPAHRRHGSF
jgi:hypothetical protein